MRESPRPEARKSEGGARYLRAGPIRKRAARRPWRPSSDPQTCRERPGRETRYGKAGPRDLWSLDALLGAWSATPRQRRAWRRAAQNAEKLLRSPAHWDTPAILTGLVQARVATALMAAGLRRADLLGRQILTLGAHIGLEARILRDWGADVRGVEQHRAIAGAGLQAHIVRMGDLEIGKALSVLEKDPRHYDHILALAPSDADWPSRICVGLQRLKPGGSFLVVAYWRDIPLIFHDTMEEGLEGTMGVGVWRVRDKPRPHLPSD